MEEDGAMSDILEKTFGEQPEGWITSDMVQDGSISTGRVYRSKSTGEYRVERDFRYLVTPTEAEIKEIHGR